MDTHVTIWWYGDQEAEAVDKAFAAMMEVEETMSAYAPASEVAAINAAAGEGGVNVSPETVEVIAMAIEIAELTAGAYDPTVFPLVELWEEEPVPLDAQIEERLALVDYEQIRLEAGIREVELLREGMGLDLGGIAKGYAVDRAAQVLRDAGLERALIDAGGDLYGVGQRMDDTPWRIAVQHPRKTDEYLAIVSLAEEAVVTSGDYQRYKKIDGVRYHHIYDPHTGYPADAGLISTTVVASNTAWADGLSTGLLVLGPTSAMDLVERLEGVDALLVTEEGDTLVSSGLSDRLELLSW